MNAVLVLPLRHNGVSALSIYVGDSTQGISPNAKDADVEKALLLSDFTTKMLVKQITLHRFS